MNKLVLIRHGQSIWNKENRFTGWKDVDLSAQGIEEAKKAGQLLLDANFDFDCAFTSVLKRAVRTLWIVLDEMDRMHLPVSRSWRLNERHYGALTGLDKAETAKKYGEGQVHVWRRSFDVLPPLLEKNDKEHPAHDFRYRNIDPRLLPAGESLETTITRVIPFWNDEIVPKLRSNQRVLVVAHGNSLRSLIKHIDNVSADEIASVNVPTGVPLVYEFDENLRTQKSYYLGDEAEIKKQVEEVAKQGKSS